MNEMLEDDPHTPWLRPLASDGDWAALARYWLAHGLPGPAIEAAIELVAAKAVLEGQPWTTLVHYLEQVRANPSAPCKLPRELVFFPQATAKLTISLISLFPTMALCEQLSAVPFANRETPARCGIQAAIDAIQIASVLSDLAMEAFCHGLAARAHAVLGERPAAEGHARKSAEGYLSLAVGRPRVYKSLAASSLNSLANRLSEMGQTEEALTKAQAAFDIFDELAAQDRASFQPALALALKNLANRLNEMGRIEEALKKAQGAAELYRKLVASGRTDLLADLAGSFNNVAAMLSIMHQPERALASAKLAVGLRRYLVTLNPDGFLPDFGKSLLILAPILGAMDRLEEALATSQEAVKVHQMLVAQNRTAFLPALALAHNNLANGLHALGREAEALVQAQEAANCYNEALLLGPGDDLPDMGRLPRDLAFIFRAQGLWHEALAHAHEAVEFYRVMVKQRGLSFLPELGLSLNCLAETLADLGAWEEGLARTQEAMEINQKLAEQSRAAHLPSVAHSVDIQTRLLDALGRREEALVCARQTVNWYEGMAAQNRLLWLQELASSLNNLANILSAMGQFKEALTHAQKVVAFYEELATRNRVVFLPDLCLALNTLAIMLSDLGRKEEALARTREALKLQQDPALPNRPAFLPKLAALLANMANRLDSCGLANEALAHVEAAVKIQRGMVSDNRVRFLPSLASSLGTQARLLAKTGRWEESQRFLEESAELFDEYSRNYPTACLEELQKTFTNLGEVLMRKNFRPGYADNQAAHDALCKARDYAEKFRLIFHDPSQRERVQTESLRLYELLVKSSVGMADASIDPQDRLAALRSAVDAAEASRARQLMDLLAEEELVPVEASPQLRSAFLELRRRLRAARHELQEAEERHQRSADVLPTPKRFYDRQRTEGSRDPGGSMFKSVSSQGDATLSRLRRQVSDLQVNHERLLGELRQSDSEYDPDRHVRPASCAEIQSLLPTDKITMVVQYFLDEYASCALVITKEDVFSVKLPNLNNLRAWGLARKWMKAYYSGPSVEKPPDPDADDLFIDPLFEEEAMESQWANKGGWERALPEMLDQVAKVAVWPVWEELQRRGFGAFAQGQVRLVLSPHRALHLFPLHACGLTAKTNEIYLGDQFEVSYTPSLSMLRRCLLRKKVAAGGVFLTGNPTEDLPFAEIETVALSRRYECPKFLKDEVTTQRVLGSASQSKRWNYSGHSKFNPIQPLDSALMLAGSKEQTSSAATLTLRQILRELRLEGNELTVINGCEGALAQPRPTDDHLSLSTGMLYAGARCVVSTLWRVGDLSSALLSDYFHAELERGKCPSAALREAQKWLREDIKSGVELRDKLLPPLLELLSNEKLRDECRKESELCANLYPDSPPFESPAHWAQFIASGVAWPVSEMN